MNADTDIQVWLETYANTHPGIIVAYVQSTESKTLHYHVRAIREGRGNKSEVSQSGVVSTTADKPVALNQMSLSSTNTDNCKIDVVLTETGAPDRSYHFDCPN